MEFLMGRALGNMIINLSSRDEIKESIEELGLDEGVHLQKTAVKIQQKQQQKQR